MICRLKTMATTRGLRTITSTIARKSNREGIITSISYTKVIGLSPTLACRRMCVAPGHSDVGMAHDRILTSSDNAQRYRASVQPAVHQRVLMHITPHRDASARQRICKRPASSTADKNSSTAPGKRATSLREASRNPGSVVELDLGGSKDFVCETLVCANFGSICVCKLARWLFQTAPQLTKLRSLRINGNALQTIPDPVWSLTQLEELDLSSNQLKDIPPEIVNLKKLRRLDLSNNLLSERPAVLDDMNPDLIVIADGNPYTHLS